MAWETLLDKKIAECLPNLRVLSQEPMSRHTSFHVGGPAKRMAFPKSKQEIMSLINAAYECDAKPLVIGNGTNLLAPDEGLDRLIINTSNSFHYITSGLEENEILIEAGASLRRVAEFACQHGLQGLEFAHGIPGTLGGAVYMNAGAYDGEISQVLKNAQIFFPKEGVQLFSCEDLQLHYRHSLLSDFPEAVLICATVRLQSGDETTIRARMKELMKRRQKTQPLEYASAGSTFKRPPGYFAGTLIEQCGLKGFCIGGAQVSEKHAGFLINRGGATFAEIIALIKEVQKRVLDQTGVFLEPEVRIVH